MKNKIVLIAFLALAILLVSTIRPVEIYAPELFGYGSGVRIELAGYEAAIIYSRWDEFDFDFVFIMFGQKTSNVYSGKIVQVYGQKINTYPPYDCSNEVAYCYQRENKENWRGWIEFRGQARPMCGGNKAKYPCLKWRPND